MTSTSILQIDKNATSTHVIRTMEAVPIRVIKLPMELLNVVVTLVSRLLMRTECAFQKMLRAMIPNSAAPTANAFPGCGHVIMTMIAVITATKTKISVHFTLVGRTNTVAAMVAASSSLGNVTTKMIVVTSAMKKDATIPNAPRVNSHVPITNVYLLVKYVMESTIAKTTKPQMKVMNYAHVIEPAPQITSNVRIPISAWSHIGSVMAITIVATTAMKTASCARRELALRTASVVPTIVASQPHGIAMVMMIVAIRLMSQRIIANLRRGPVSAIFSHVTMETVSHGYTFVTVTMIAWTIVMKIHATNVTRENVMTIENSLARKIETGAEPNVYQSVGFVMASLIA